jgi:hypothetical protein
LKVFCRGAEAEQHGKTILAQRRGGAEKDTGEGRRVDRIMFVEISGKETWRIVRGIWGLRLPLASSEHLKMEKQNQVTEPDQKGKTILPQRRGGAEKGKGNVGF